MSSADMTHCSTTSRRRGLAVPLTLAAFGLTATARAENIQQFEPAPGPSGGFSLEDHRTPGHLRLTADVYANYGSKPLVVIDASGRNEVPVVEHLTTFNLIAGLTLIDRLLLSVDLPISHIAGEGAKIEDQEGVSLGDLRVMIRGRILGGDDGFGLALALPVSFETGNEFGHTSAGATILHPKLIGGYDLGAFDVFANVGARIPTESDTIDGTSTKLASTATYAVGLGYQLGAVRLLGEVFGAVPFEDAASKKTANPLEGLLGARWAFLPGLHLNAGAGAGIIGDAGTPAFRALLGLGYQSPGSDGAPEVEAEAAVASAPPVTEAPPAVEAVAAPAETTVADEPLYAEGGEQEADEAFERRAYRERRKAREARAAGEDEAAPAPPARPDDDAEARAARAQKELDDEPPPNHGKKRREARPVEPERAPAPEDDPPPRREPPKRERAAEPDDGAGDVAGIQRAPRGRVLPLGHEGVGAGKKGGHKKRPSIFFGENVTTLDKRAAAELGRVAALLDEAPAGAKIRLSGHSDDANPGDVSLRQSRRRAEAAKIWLVEHGVPAERIVLEWYGDTAPIGKNKTSAGRSVNRRVDWAFVVVSE